MSDELTIKWVVKPMRSGWIQYSDPLVLVADMHGGSAEEAFAFYKAAKGEPCSAEEKRIFEKQHGLPNKWISFHPLPPLFRAIEKFQPVVIDGHRVTEEAIAIALERLDSLAREEDDSSEDWRKGESD